MTQVILDTNILLIPGSLGVDVFEQIITSCDFKVEFAILKGTITELERIQKEQRGRHKAAAKLGLQLIKQKNVQILPSDDRHLDDQLVELSQQGLLVVTQDAHLKKRLKKPYATLRSKNRVILVR